MRDRFSATFAALTAENTKQTFAETFLKTNWWNIFDIRRIFRSGFRFSLATPFFEQFSTSKLQILVQSPFCERFPLMLCVLSPNLLRLFVAWQVTDGLGSFSGHFCSADVPPTKLSCLMAILENVPSDQGRAPPSKAWRHPQRPSSTNGLPLKYCGRRGLEDPNLLTLRSLDSSCPFLLSDNRIRGQWTQTLPMLWSQG